MRKAANISRDNLVALGTCFGKFTKTGKFRLQITCLDYLAQFAEYKVWVKPSAELSYLYGNHVLKSGLGRITENTPQYVLIAAVIRSAWRSLPLADIRELLYFLCPTSLYVPSAAPTHFCTIQPLTALRQARFRRDGEVHSRVPQARSYRHLRIPPGRRGRVPARRGHSAGHRLTASALCFPCTVCSETRVSRCTRFCCVNFVVLVLFTANVTQRLWLAFKADKMMTSAVW